MSLLNSATLTLLQENNGSVPTNHPSFQLKRNPGVVGNPGTGKERGLTLDPAEIDALIHLPKGLRFFT